MPGEEQNSKGSRKEGRGTKKMGREEGREGGEKEGRERNKQMAELLSWEITESVSKSHLLGWSNSLDKIFPSFYPKGECQHSGS